MKLLIGLILAAIALSQLFSACRSKNQKDTPGEESPEAAVVSGQEEFDNNSVPEMKIEVRGFTYTLTVGEGVVGHYDKAGKYWACTEDEPIFETRQNHQGDGKYTVLSLKDKEGIGLVDENGKIIVLPMYKGMEVGFTNGFCEVVSMEDKYGLIAEDGSIALPAIYDDVWHKDIQDGIIKAKKDDKSGFTDLKGKTVIPFEYEALEQAGEGLIWFMAQPKRWGCINYRNEVVVQPEFTNPSPFADGKTTVQKSDGKEYTVYTDGRIERL